MISTRLIGGTAGVIAGVLAACAAPAGSADDGTSNGEPPAIPALPAAPGVKVGPMKVAARDDSAAEKLGWHLGTQAWTFRDRSTFEAIDTAHAMGLKYIELYPGQQMKPGNKDLKVGSEMTKEQRAELKAKLKASGVAAMSFGVVAIDNDEKQARTQFEFVKDMGMTTVTCEPKKEAWDLVAKLADEYGLNVAVHNHPKPSYYWNPDTVLEFAKDRTKRVGACADTGHWPRSGLGTVESLKKLEGRIIELHFKDITDGVDQPWGTGKGDARAMLEELHRQGFKGQIYVEYEDGEGKPLERNVIRSIGFFDTVAVELAAKTE